MRAIVLCLFGVSVLCGCGGEPTAAQERPVTSSESAESRDEGASGAASPSSDAPMTVRFDLARHIARAELRRGNALWIDFGVPGAHKYTLGGWRTRAGTTQAFDGTTTMLIPHVTGFVQLPIEREGQCHLTIRGRAFRDGRTALYIDGQSIGHVRLPTDGSFTVASVTIPASKCSVGEHDLRFRVPSTGRTPGHRRAGVAIDWVRLGATPAEEGLVPPTPEALTPRVNGQRVLHIPRGWRLAYTMEALETSRLRGRLQAGGGRLQVRVMRDGGTEQLEQQVASDGSLDLGLTTLAPHIVRIELEALEGDVSIRDAQVVSPRQGVAQRLTRRPRNVLIYLTDTLRADHLRPYAPDTRVQTPGLTQWARRAATFLAGHSQENWTKPSVATLLSGLYPWEHHATSEDAQVPSSVQLMGERLQEEGFHTGAFIANGFVSDRFGFRQGWSTYRNYVREGRRNHARFVAGDVLAWLDARPTDQPFFLYVHTIDPHVPYIPPAEDLRLYDPEPYRGVVDFRQDRGLLEKVKSGRLRLNRRDRRRLEALYDGEITYHDRHFASMIEALRRRGLAEDTMVVFTSDHGEEFFDHDSVGHGHSVWEELIRVPLMFQVPGITDAAQRITEAVGLVDVVPTVYDLLQIETPEDVSGRSVLPLLLGAREDAPRPTITGFMNGWRTVVVGRYKLIHRTDRHWMVYNLTDDPRETNDLAAQSPLAVRYLRGLLGLSIAEAEAPPHTSQAHEAERIEIDETLRRQLEALGYAGASRAPTSAE